MSELEQTIRRYLLGELSESEQSALEKLYFTDPQVFDEVLKSESNLVDTYVRGQLSSEVRERFEQTYLAHPARSERVKFAACLLTRLDKIQDAAAVEQPSLPVSLWPRLPAWLRGQRPALRFSMALATLLLLIGGVWFLIESRRRQQRELAQIQAAQANQERHAREQEKPAQPRPAETPQPTNRLTGEENRLARNPQITPQPSPNPGTKPAPPVVYLALNVGGVRGSDGSGMQTLVIPQGTSQAQLFLNLKDSSYPSYRVSLQMIGGAEIFSQSGVKPRAAKTGARFAFTIPAGQFESGDYVLTLRGVSANGEVEDLSKSLFRVEKK